MRRPPTYLAFLVTIAWLVSAAGCSAPEMYTAEPIHGRVIDAETKEPLPGVIVVAEWVLVSGLMGPVPFEDLEVREAVTGADGTYQIDGWGPTPIHEGRLDDEDPQLVLYKVGWEFKVLRNRLRPPGDPAPLVGRLPGRSVWSGRTIELAREPPSFKRASSLLSHVQTAFRGERCLWKRMPRLLSALLEASTLAEDGGRNARQSMHEMLGSRARHAACGSLEQIIGKSVE